MQDKDDRIGVFVRIRPYQEKEANSTFILQQTETDITVKDKESVKESDLRFSFDHVFSPKTDQQELYDRIGQPIVDSSFEGINGTIFAYGQTSSGKTYTCVGPDCDDEELKGLLPRCVSGIFQRISGSPNYLQFRIKVSLVEIYMQKIRDLLDSSKTDLKIRENKTKGIYIQDVTEQYVSSAEETMKVFKKGVSNRSVAFTNMNDLSSRSHMAFILTLHQNNLKDGSAKSGKITIVDLAGSQKVSKTHAEGKVLGEAKQINKSLSSLGNVINALTDSKASHIPYRDSKLTRLLQESLGGNSKTSLIINISPSAYNGSESISSLRFGFRAKQIKNKPKINKQYTIAELLVLLQKSQKRNQELQLLLKQLTVSKKVKKKGQIEQSHLQEDHPNLEDENLIEETVIPVNRRSVIKTIQKHYETENDSEGQTQKEIKQEISPPSSPRKQLESQKISDTNQIQAKLRSLLDDKQEEISILGQELNRINNEKINLVRELDICKQRFEVAAKEARMNGMKFNSQKRENQNLLQRYIKQNLQNQQKEETISRLNDKIVHFQEKMLKLSQMHSQAKSQNKVFGDSSKILNEQTLMFLEQTLNQKQNEEFKIKALDQIDKDQEIQRLNSKIKQLEIELTTFQHLQESKEGFIKQKLRFVSDRDQLYKDLENRVLKVIQLEEDLDIQKDKRKYFEQLISMQESEKNRKIISLERHIQSISEQYYVLKGQQSSWKKNNEKVQKKNAENFKKILALQAQNLQLKAEIESLQMKCEQFESINQNASELDFQLSEIEQEGTGNIVKVVRSGIYV